MEECFPQREPNWTGKPVRTKVDLGRKAGQLVHVASLASQTLPSETWFYYGVISRTMDNIVHVGG